MMNNHKPKNRRERRAAKKQAKGLNPLSLPLAEKRKAAQAEREELRRQHILRTRALAHMIGGNIRRA